MSRHFKIITKEVGRDNPIETEYIGDVDRAYLIKFFGLREDAANRYDFNS